MIYSFGSIIVYYYCYFYFVGIQEMGIPEAITHAIEKLPIGKHLECIFAKGRDFIFYLAESRYAGFMNSQKLK